MNLFIFLRRVLSGLLLISLLYAPLHAQEAGLLNSLGKYLQEVGKSAGEIPPSTNDNSNENALSKNMGYQSNDKRLALVIGNADYKNSPLANPVNDARAMAARLRNLGFEVIQRENLKTREIGTVYREFRSKISPGGTALVFYAGHGLQFKGQNYFPAVDSEINSEEDVPLQSLNLSQLLDNMEEARAGVSLVFLDACRDNPFARRFRSATRGLAKVEAASGTLIHYATKPGSVAADGDGQNGTYTEALLAQMNEPGVQVELMLKKVTNRVVNKTKGKQEPWVEGSLRGEFYFIFQGPTMVANQPQIDPETEAWNTAQGIGSDAAFETYLDSYPKGRYTTAAKIKLADLKKVEKAKPARVGLPPPVTEDPESQFWNEVKSSGSREYYDAYLKQYPRGKYLALARLEIKKQDDKDKADQARQDAAQRLAAEQQRQVQQRGEREAWETAKSGESVASYSAYLDSYPKGQFALLAQAARQKAERQASEREKQERQDKLAAEKLAAEIKKREAESQREIAEQEKQAAERVRLQAEKAAKEMNVGKVFKDCEDCPEIVVIPAGSFDMGENDDLRRVTLKSFALGRTEVTQAQWQAVMGGNPSKFIGECGNNCPVEYVNWEDAQEFVRRLNAKTGKVYRLPSEAEWEYACRAGGRDEYCGGNNLDAVGWYRANSSGKTQAVAGKQANAWGLYDMNGNVWELTQDCWSERHSGAPNDGTVRAGGDCSYRVVRGASWSDSPQSVRTTNRNRNAVSGRFNDSGFRLARTLAP